MLSYFPSLRRKAKSPEPAAAAAPAQKAPEPITEEAPAEEIPAEEAAADQPATAAPAAPVEVAAAEVAEEQQPPTVASAEAPAEPAPAADGAAPIEPQPAAEVTPLPLTATPLASPGADGEKEEVEGDAAAVVVTPAVEAAGTSIPTPVEETAQQQAVDTPLPVTPTPVPEDAKSPVLSPADESFISSALSSADDTPPVLVLDSADTSGAATPMEVEKKESEKDEGKKDEKKSSGWAGAARTRWDGLKRSASTAMERRKSKSKSKSPGPDKDKKKKKDKAKDKGKQKEVLPKEEQKEAEEGRKSQETPKEELSPEDKETAELREALDGLSLAAEGGRAFSISAETKALLDHFVQILKDLGNGVPTAYDDLTSLLESSSAQLESTFKSLPSFLQRLVSTLPDKVSKNLSLELLRATAAVAPAATAETLTLKQLVAKPGLIMSLLKSVVNVLKTRFPAVLGANVAVSMGLFVVLLALWYCYKRGREERIKVEAAEVEAAVAAVEEAAAKQQDVVVVGGPSTGVDAAARAVSSGIDLGPGLTVDGIPAGGAGKLAEPVVTEPAKELKVE